MVTIWHKPHMSPLTIQSATTGPLFKKGGDVVAASDPTIWTSTYALESRHCSRLLIEPFRWVQTVHMFTLRLYVSHDLIT